MNLANAVRITAAVLLVGLAGCGGSEVTPTTALPAPPTTVPPALEVSCGGVGLGTPGAVLLPDTPLDAAAMEALRTATVPLPAEEGAFFSRYFWTVATAEQSRLVLFGTLDSGFPGPEAPYATAGLVDDGSGWRLTGWGQCRIEVAAPGYGRAAVILSPDAAPDPGADRLEVWINEQKCAGGLPPIDREILPVVVADGERVVVTVLVEPVAGGAACPSNPWHPVTISLDAPLGDRLVYDGGTFPPTLLEWPPPDEALDR